MNKSTAGNNLEKKAVNAFTDGIRHDPVSARLGRQEAAKQLLTLLGLGATTGISLGGAMGLKNLLLGNKYTPPNSAGPQLPKIVGSIGSPSNNRYIEKDANANPRYNRIVKWLAQYLPTPHTKEVLANSWGMPLGVGVTGAGLYGGYKLVDSLLGAEKKLDQSNQLEKAKKDYQSSIADEYQSLMLNKSASDNTELNALSQDYAKLEGTEKKAFWDAFNKYLPFVQPIMDSYNSSVGYETVEGFKGATNTAALLAALGMGTMGYNWGKNTNQKKLLEKAIKLRQHKRHQGALPPIVIDPNDDK